MKRFDVTAMGELLIDCTDHGISEQGNPVFEANPGGAPCNVLNMLNRLGRKTAFIGKVGNDGFGHMLANTVRKEGICTDGLCFDPVVHTTLALVLKKENGDRDFSFYRNPGADNSLSADEVHTDLIHDSRIFHFGSLSLTDEPVRSATFRCIEEASKSGILISFDPNLREPLWSSLDEAWKQIDWGLRQCDILKISDNEIAWFTGLQNYEEAVVKLQKDYPSIRLISLSLGPDGSRIYMNGYRVEEPAFLQKETIETTGAGDTFCACILNMALEKGLDQLDEESLHTGLVFANAAASIVTTRYGALRVMPSKKEVEDFILAHHR